MVPWTAGPPPFCFSTKTHTHLVLLVLLVLFVLFCQVTPLVLFRAFRAFFVLFGAFSHIETHSHGPMDSSPPPFCFSTKTHTHTSCIWCFSCFSCFFVRSYPSCFFVLFVLFPCFLVLFPDFTSHHTDTTFCQIWGVPIPYLFPQI